MRSLMLVVLLTASGAASADVYKCTDAEGRKVYQDLPCTGAQRATPFDPEAGNVTTIDSETSRREAQGALLTREETRERHVEVNTPASADTQVTITGPDLGQEPYYDEVGRYPLYGDGRRHDHHRRGDRDRRDGHSRPDETPMMDSARRNGSNYVPSPPTIRQVAPRSPSATSRSGARSGSDRDDERRGQTGQ